MPDAQHLQALLVQCAEKRESALAELYRLASPHLFALARRMLRDQAAAEDVLQECFVSIWRQAGQYQAYVERLLQTAKVRFYSAPQGAAGGAPGIAGGAKAP